MVVIRLSEDEARRSEAILAEAERHYAEMLDELAELRRAMRAGPGLSETEFRKALGEYRRAVQTVFDERKRVEELRKRSKGIHADYAIDFDALRSAIGRRLDRLRAAGDPGGVS